MTTSTAKKTAAKKAPAKKTAAKKAAAPEAEQHPALVGEPGVEVAQRSADQPAEDTLTHRKDFVVLAADFDDLTSDGADDFHRANIEAARQYLISQGMRPTKDGDFVGAEDHPDGASLILHYDISVEPAVVATEQTVQHAYVMLDDQHAAEDDAEGDAGR